LDIHCFFEACHLVVFWAFSKYWENIEVQTGLRLVLYPVMGTLQTLWSMVMLEVATIADPLGDPWMRDFSLIISSDKEQLLILSKKHCLPMEVVTCKPVSKTFNTKSSRRQCYAAAYCQRTISRQVIPIPIHFLEVLLEDVAAYSLETQLIAFCLASLSVVPWASNWSSKLEEKLIEQPQSFAMTEY
jgi:hypothetical protein